MKHALFNTLPGRAIVIAAVVKVIAFVLGVIGAAPSFLSVVDTVASIVLVAGGVYFFAQGLAFASRRLLWRVRRKLIISYIFIGFIPSMLIVAFFLLGGLFLFSNFSSYLVQNQFRALSDRAMSEASSIAQEIQRGGRDAAPAILVRRRAAIEREFPDASVAVVPVNRTCNGPSQESQPASPSTSPGADPGASAPPAGDSRAATAGSWTHVEPPSALPAWIENCNGFTALVPYRTFTAVPADRGSVSAGSPPNDVGVIARAVSFMSGSNSGYAVVVDRLVDQTFREQLRSETGVHLTTLQSMSSSVRPLDARSAPTTGVADVVPNTLPVTSVTFLELRDWLSGERGTAIASMRLSIPDIYRRISTQASGGQRFSQSLLLLLIVIGVLFLIIQALAFIVGLALARSITGSVHELFAGTERVRQGDFTHKIAIHAHDQLGELAGSFNSMTASIENLLVEQAEKKRLEEELRIAHEIQMSLLPQGPLGMPGLSVTAISVPAREVGGDYYDFFPLDDRRLGVLIADVSGKGTSAALYMAELKGLVLSLSRIHTSPRDLLISANQIIAEHLDSRSFITMTYAVLDLRARVMTYARAGHTPLIYLPATGSRRELQILAPDGLVLGLKIDKGELFERLLQEETMTIHEGDLFVLFTDGITEAMDATDDCFGDARLARIIEEHAHLSGEELRERVLREVAAFVGSAPQHDDMTMILLKIGDLDFDSVLNAEIVVVAEA